MSTTALILAAGRGTRLRPHTDHRPKCLVELAGQSLLARQWQSLRAAGVDDIRVITGYRAADIEALGYPTVHNPSFATTNMVSTLFCAREHMTGAADLLIVYGDLAFEPRIIRALLAEDAPLSTTIDRSWYRYWSLRMEDPLTDAETLRLSDDGDILELGGRPASLHEIEGQYMGLSKVRADHVERFGRAWAELDPVGSYGGRHKQDMPMTAFFSVLIAGGWRLRAVPVDGGWLEVDRGSDLELYHQLLRTGGLAPFYDPFWDASWPRAAAHARRGGARRIGGV